MANGERLLLGGYVIFGLEHGIAGAGLLPGQGSLGGQDSQLGGFKGLFGFGDMVL